MQLLKTKRRTVNQRKAELLAAAGVDPAESAPPQMLSDLAEKLRQERVPHRIIPLVIFRGEVCQNHNT